MSSFHLLHVELLDEKKEMIPLFCKTGKNGFSLKRRLPVSMPGDFQLRFPFFSGFSDSTNELVVPNALAGVLLTMPIDGSPRRLNLDSLVGADYGE